MRAEAAKDAVRRRLMRVRHRGDAVQCPCCKRTFSSFVDLGGRRNWGCPGCGAQNRHRMLAWYLEHDGVDLLQPGRSVLHFAPEAFLGRLLGPGRGYEYLSADLDDPQAMEHFDIQDIPHPDVRFDTVVCSHVLEHVPDDRAAMRELWRVLRPGGTVVVLVPVDHGREHTYEDPTITTPEGRLAAFWQSDHVRLYGRDAAQRLAEPGFEIAIDGYVFTLPDHVVVRHGAGSPGMYVLRRPTTRSPERPQVSHSGVMVLSRLPIAVGCVALERQPAGAGRDAGARTRPSASPTLYPDDVSEAFFASPRPAVGSVSPD